jgi:hypothetical protein
MGKLSSRWRLYHGIQSDENEPAGATSWAKSKLTHLVFVVILTF